MKKVFIFAIIMSIGFVLNGCGLTSSDNTHTVVFDSNGGSVFPMMTIESGETFLPTETPAKQGYIFDGWYLDAHFNFLVAFNAGVTSDMTLYAKWITEEEVISEEEINEIIFDFLKNYDVTADNKDMVASMIVELIKEGKIDVLELAQENITSMLEEVKKSVVMIDCYNDGVLETGGSGVIYKQVGSTYYVLTNEHVVNGFLSDDFEITVFGRLSNKIIPKGQVTLLGTSVLHDMAVLRFDSNENFRVIEWGTKHSLKVGQIVFSIGSPLDLPNTASMGVISAYNRKMTDSFGMDTTTIQHTASINPGSSGGALVNIHGQFIGLNTMSYVNTSIGEGINSLHFAVQVDILSQMIPSLE